MTVRSVHTPGWRPAVSVLVAVALLGVLLGTAQLAARAQSRVWARPAQVAQVRFIYRGLSVQAPRHKRMKGRVKMPLYSQYFLQTLAQQKASIRFRDGTTLHMNQQTDAILRSPHLTYVGRGEVYEAIAPGTDHQIKTAAAVAAAVGTEFDIKIVPGGVKFIVVRGVLRVKNRFGKQFVKNNHESIVIANHPPQAPQPVDASKAAAWTGGLPTPQLGENIALDANGGHVVGYSSQYTSATQGDYWDAKFINDGNLSTGWESNSGSVTDQWVKIGFAGGKTFQISKVLIDPAATRGDPSTADLKDFEIRVSTTGTSDGDFVTVLRGTCQQKATLQPFPLPHPVAARYVELYALDNYGSPDWIAVAEFEVVSPSG